MFDYGTAGNMVKYGQPTPPPYNLGLFPTYAAPRSAALVDVTHILSTLPLALFTGGEDYLADPTDVATLISQLPIVPMVRAKNRSICLSVLGARRTSVCAPRPPPRRKCLSGAMCAHPVLTLAQRIYPLIIKLLDTYNQPAK